MIQRTDIYKVKGVYTALNEKDNGVCITKLVVLGEDDQQHTITLYSKKPIIWETLDKGGVK